MKAILSFMVAVVMAFYVGRYVTNRQRIEPPELLPMCLTPATVDVSGYSTSDGREVAPYSRRPPGSVTHDIFVNIAISQINEERMRPYRYAKVKAERRGFYTGLASIPITAIISWLLLGLWIKGNNEKEERQVQSP